MVNIIRKDMNVIKKFIHEFLMIFNEINIGKRFSHYKR